MSSNTRLLIKITRETLPQAKEKYPFIYLEHGRLEVDDSSVKWVSDDGSVIQLPIATINAILLGPGTTTTHAAIKTVAAANCLISWVGENSLLFYAVGLSPTSDSRNFQHQFKLAADPTTALKVAINLFKYRFPEANLESKTLKEMMGMEGYRVRSLYRSKADEYGVGWKGRKFIPGKFELSDLTNKIITASNAALYGILCSIIHSMGYSPYIGFIHTGSPLPFVYDLSDLYKDYLCIDLAFSLTRSMAGKYDKNIVASAFCQRVLKTNLLEKIVNDILNIFGAKNGCSDSK